MRLDDNPLSFEKKKQMINQAVSLLRRYLNWIRQLPQATGLLFAARTPLGRSVKIGLFGVGLALPLGSLIWVLLFLHGTRIEASDGAAQRAKSEDSA